MYDQLGPTMNTGVAVDASGHVYVTGVTRGRLDSEPAHALRDGSSDYYLQQLDVTGPN
jgi:hypothetical protein